MSACAELSLDGVKMLALACVAVLTASTKPRGELRRWLRAVSFLLAAALVASGYAYLSLTNAMAWTALISGPLLLLWVAAIGITMTTWGREAAAASAPLADSV
jgi:hypothetical protein